MYTLILHRLLDEAHKQVSIPELQDAVWDETVTDFLQPHSMPAETVKQNGPQQAKQSSGPELVTNTDQPSVGMETQTTDKTVSSSGMLQPIAAVAMQNYIPCHIILIQIRLFVYT